MTVPDCYTRVRGHENGNFSKFYTGIMIVSSSEKGHDLYPDNFPWEEGHLFVPGGGIASVPISPVSRKISSPLF